MIVLIRLKIEVQQNKEFTKKFVFHLHTKHTKKRNSNS
jgi:hypothetical protein